MQFLAILVIGEVFYFVNSDCSGATEIHTTHIIESDIIPHNIVSNSKVALCNQTTVLTELVHYEGKANISISGNSTVIKCQDNIEAGLHFRNIESLRISGLKLLNCGHEFDTTEGSMNASISIVNCTNVHISDLTVAESPGTGLVLLDNYEDFIVCNSSFKQNGRGKSSGESGGNGVYIEANSQFGVNYQMIRCRFIDNSALNNGGGVCIFIHSEEVVRIEIENATISGNTAKSYGGGTYVAFHKDTSHTLVAIKGSKYSNNIAHYGGGHHTDNKHKMQQDLITVNCTSMFQNNDYIDNKAFYGGGVSIFSTRSYSSSRMVQFEGCRWRSNNGLFGSAIAILPNAQDLDTEGNLPRINFSNAIIERNFARKKLEENDSLTLQYTQGYGALYCSNHRMTFKSTNRFSHNDGTAVYMGLCTATFSRESQTTFSFNTGYFGGAIYLMSSVLYMSDHTFMIFRNNTAYSKGGAIYYNSFTFHVYDYSKTCFLTYIKTNDEERSITVIFENNTAGTNGTGYGQSIFADSLYPCYRQLENNTSDVVPNDLFSGIGNFTYDSHSNLGNQLATGSNSSMITDEGIQETLYVVPGKVKKLPFKDRDDLNQSSRTLYLVTIDTLEIEIDSAYTLISTPEIKVYGCTGEVSKVTLSALESRPKALSFHLKILPCPPGYVSKNHRCVCAYNTDSNYTGIRNCNISSWTARRAQSYWVGYNDSVDEDDDTLLTGACPLGFCSSNNSLPSTASKEDLNKIVCQPRSRTGILCGQCEKNNSVYYHSLHFKCGTDKYCHLGLLFYILSEILPVTLIFLIIVFFGINFTSGTLNGFIFYSQVVVMFHITADNFIQTSDEQQIANNILHSLYLTFNLHPFAVERFSFCLYKGAGSLDAIAFSYITLAYSFLLILGVIFLMNKLNMRYCCCSPLNRCLGGQWRSLEKSIIHGLTAFLILCYANCTRASLLLIGYANVRGKSSEHKNYVVFYDGSKKWLSPEHLPYAIPAAILLLLFVLSPPLLLIFYPIHYRVLHFLKISESRCIRILFNPIEKLKPLLDSFQGCFKDEFRFFSGLYFLYRFLFLLTVTLSSMEQSYYIIMSQLLIMLMLHSLCQPYKKKLHNIIDSLLFGNLAVINVITMYNMSGKRIQPSTSVTVWLQNTLIAQPLLIMALFLLVKTAINKKVFAWMKAKIKAKISSAAIDDNDDELLPARLVCELSDFSNSHSYKRVQE